MTEPLQAWSEESTIATHVHDSPEKRYNTSMRINTKIKAIITNYFKERPEVSAVYLYGSQARREAKRSSDIDLAVLTTDKSRYIGLNSPQILFTQELSEILNKKVEVQDLKTVSIDFAHRVLTEGKLLHSNNERARVAFEEKILRVYFDMKPAIDEYYKYLAKIAKKGELHVRYT